MTQPAERGPIFIGGPDRCGKTTLRAFLASHPSIAIPDVGSNMWTYFYGQYGDLSQEQNFERCLQAMIHYKHVRFLQPDPERIRREFWQGEPTYARLFALFQIHYAEREGKPRWGDQTGLVERYADQIFAAYPGAKMLHLVRDPRDRYEASLALWPDGKGRAGGAVARWQYSVGLARRNLLRYPGRYKIVRYESLVLHTEETLREICAFLDEPFVPEMLSMSGAPKHRARLLESGESTGGLLSPERLLSPAYIGRYRGRIPKGEIAFLQSLAGAQMRALGYTLEPVPFSAAEALRYRLVDWPANLGRMLAWRLVETVQHRLPGVFGRTPRAMMRLQADGHPAGSSARGQQP